MRVVNVVPAAFGAAGVIGIALLTKKGPRD